MIEASSEPTSDLRIATYNLWNPIFEQKYSGKNTWDSRLPKIIENIHSAQPDILLLQEVNISGYHDLFKNEEFQKKYKGYYFSHFPSESIHSEGRDGLAIFFKVEKMNNYAIRHSMRGSRPTHRRDVYMDFEMPVNKTTLRFRVSTTHLDAGSDLEKGNQQLANLVEDVLNPQALDKVDFVVVAGDFNEAETGHVRPRAHIMEKMGFVTDGSVMPTRAEELNVRHKGHIDWIYFKKLSNISLKLIPLEPIGHADASDHKLLMTDVRF